MARRLVPGELGKIGVSKYGKGVMLGAMLRDEAGKAHRLRVTGPSYDVAHARLLERAALIMSGSDTTLTLDSTIADACAVWLEHVRADYDNEATIVRYESVVRAVIIPTCGALALRQVSVGRLDAIVRRLAAERSVSTAQRFKKALSLVFGMLVRYDVLPSNPVRDVSRLPGSPKKMSYLTPEQLRLVWRLAEVWRSPDGRRRPDRDKFLDATAIAAGTSARIGEILGLQRQDVIVSDDGWWLRVASTQQQIPGKGLVLKATPKHSRQSRLVALPQFAIDAVQRRLDKAAGEPEAFLFATRSGAAYSLSNFQRLTRDFRDSHADQLEAVGIMVEEFTTHVFRRTAATLVERFGGITLASRLLGHANESITRSSYVVSDVKVDRTSADILAALVSHPREGAAV